MQAQNVEEYKLIREDMGRIRTCTTSYMGFSILGSGPAFWYLGSKAFEKQGDFSIGFVAGLLSILFTLNLYLLSYKFTSHNRYAGYSKLLTHERFVPGGLLGENFFCWEICVDIVRAWDSDAKKLVKDLSAAVNLSSPIENLADRVMPYAGPHPSKDKWSRLGGFRLMLSWSAEKSGSWKLPLYIARIFAAINLTFVYFGVCSFFLVSGHPYQRTGLVLLFCVLGLMWVQFLSKIHRQMLGSETVEAFCWKFVPIRARLIQELNNQSNYSLIGVSADEPARGGRLLKTAA